VNDKSWSQVAESTSLEGFAVLDLLLMNASEPIGDIRIGDCLGCSDQDFKLLRVMIQTESKIRMLNFRISKFQLFKGLVNKTPWETVLREKGVEQSLKIFKETFLRAQELFIPTGSQCRKSEKEGKRLTWLNQNLLVKLESKKKRHRQWTGKLGR